MGDADVSEDGAERNLYKRLLTADCNKREEAITDVIGSLKNLASSALRGGNEAIMMFVAVHGPYIVTNARQCPFEDISVAFSDLLAWAKKTCMLEIEAMLDEDEDDASSDVDRDDVLVSHHSLHKYPKRESRRKRSSVDGSDTESVSEGNTSSHSSNESKGRSAQLLSSTSCSMFISPAEIEPVLTEHHEIKYLYQQVFLKEGEVPNWLRVLSCKPEVTLKIYRTLDTMTSIGPLPPPSRWYIALMVASLCRSEYWINRCENAFCRVGGSEDWITNGVHEDPKLAAFAPFNINLATAPWLITPETIRDLVDGGWTLPELVQAVVIASQMLSLCSIAKGVGLICDGAKGYKCEMPGVGMKHCQSSEELTDMLDALNGGGDPLPGTTPLETFHKLVEDDVYDEGNAASCEPERLTSISGNHANTMFQGFRERGTSKTHSYLRLSEYNWRDDSCCVVEQLLSGDLASQMDNVFSTVATMTDNDMFGSVHGIDTTRLRRMVWYYVHGLYGIVADDMDYSSINSLVGIKKAGIVTLKKFIKYVGCLTGSVGMLEYHFDHRYTQPFSSKDKVHITLLAAEARMQAALIYSMRASAKYLASKSQKS